jgi:chitin synthase
MNSSQIAAISVGGVLLTVFLSLGLYSLVLNWNNSQFSNQSIFFIKKWLLVIFILLLNALGCALVYYTRNLQVILYVILVLKSKDILVAVMFPINLVIRYLRRKTTDSEVAEAPSHIVAFVPVYTESKSQITRTLQSIVEQNQNTLLFLISDGNYNYDYLIDDLKLRHVSSYTSWKHETIDITVSYGIHNGNNIVIVRKNQNMGKKDSIILCHSIFNFAQDTPLPISAQIRDNIRDIFNLSEFHYILGIDADTVLSNGSISSLINSITSRDAIASCGIVNADTSQGNIFWNHLQNFQYLYGQYMRRTNEDLFNQVMCLPGCVSMFKIDTRFALAFQHYTSQSSDSNLLFSCVQHVGTDRRLTSLLLSTHPNRIVLDLTSHAYTCVPSTLYTFIKQRIRWCQNMYFNTLINIFTPNINFLLRFFNLIDLLRLTLIYFRVFNTVYFVFLLISFYNSSNFLQLLPFIVIISYPIVLFLIYSLFNSHLRSQYFSLLISLILNRIFSMFSTITIFTIMLFNIGNHTW